MLCVYKFRVVFHFKSSLLSNNGTDVSCGQIPQLLYKLLQPEFFVVTNFENPSSSAAVHILSRKFSHSVSEVQTKKFRLIRVDKLFSVLI